MSTTYRCSADNGCDESTIRPYLVTDMKGETDRMDYCSDCYFLARVNWNGETAKIEPPRVAYRDPQTGRTATGVLEAEYPKHPLVGVRTDDGRLIVVHRDHLVDPTHA